MIRRLPVILQSHETSGDTQDTGRKIIHIDMDCFYAAIEVRDNPGLKGKPVAVGGNENRRGVLCTCNYEARKFGVHSAMPTSRALMLCKELIVLPVNFDKYRTASKAIHEIFRQYTQKIEPLSLDEAFLDVTECPFFSGSAILIAHSIRQKVAEQIGITASAGIANNKMLAKIASDWEKPNGQFAITPDQVKGFVENLPVKKLFGVGKVTAEKLHSMNIENCKDLQGLKKEQLVISFGKFGQQLYQMSRGIDHREVITHRERKSLSTEETFSVDIQPGKNPSEVLENLFIELENRLSHQTDLRNKIKSIFVKIKFNDFSLTTIQETCSMIKLDAFTRLYNIRAAEHNKPIRLIGFGVHFICGEEDSGSRQLELDFSKFN